MAQVRFTTQVGNTPSGTVVDVSPAQAAMLERTGAVEVILSAPAVPAPPVKDEAEEKPKSRRVVTAREIREWAAENGFECPERGKIPDEIKKAYAANT